MLKRIRAWWRARQRRIDIEILWPSCLLASGNLWDARAVFALHTRMDPAWSDLREDEVCQIIEKLGVEEDE